MGEKGKLKIDEESRRYSGQLSVASDIGSEFETTKHSKYEKPMAGC